MAGGGGVCVGEGGRARVGGLAARGRVRRRGGARVVWWGMRTRWAGGRGEDGKRVGGERGGEEGEGGEGREGRGRGGACP